MQITIANLFMINSSEIRVSAYMSDMEVLTDEEKKSIEKELEELLSR